MQMVGRVYDKNGYRYGFNGQEKTPELNPSHTTALFWEYDGRLGKRWNLDPKSIVGISDYACFGNNPILYSDPMGDTWWEYIQNRIGLSTPSQRRAAEIFALRKIDNRAVIKNVKKRSIEVEYQEVYDYYDYIEQCTVIGVKIKHQHFKYDGAEYASDEEFMISNPKEKEISQNAKNYLESPSESLSEGVSKVVLNVGYSAINSPYVLLTKQTLLTGEDATFEDNMNAFIDVAPGAVLKGVGPAANVIKTEGKALDAFNDYVQKSGKGTFFGPNWQKDASKSFKANKVTQEAISNAEATKKAGDIISAAKEEGGK